MDASTLGKIDLQGPDADEFLDRVDTNTYSTLAVGSCRYGVMCRLDGMVFDDGVTSRLSEHRFLMATTTGDAAPVMDWLEEWLQTERPQLFCCGRALSSLPIAISRSRCAPASATDEPGYRLMMRSSLSAYLAAWLTHAWSSVPPSAISLTGSSRFR